MNIKTLIAVSLFLPLAGCSTVAAAKKTGVKVSTAAECTTKICLQTQLSSEQIDEKALGNGLTQYTFRMQKRQGSYLRSLGDMALLLLEHSVYLNSRRLLWKVPFKMISNLRLLLTATVMGIAAVRC